MLFSFSASAQSAGRRTLKDHVPPAIARFHLQPLEKLPDTNQLNLAISLPLRNQEALTNFLESLYDPSSPNYHHYLTPEQFTEKFGPTEEDYQKVIAFAKRSGLTIKATYPGRTLVDVSGNAATIEKTFRVTLRVYQHPTENRKFFAPDIEPSVETGVPILDISGLDNYSRPKPLLIKKNNNAGGPVSSGTGSGTAGTFLGNDFRAAYVPDTTLTGQGQTVGLVEFDGYFASDITNYMTLAKQPIVPLQNILLDGFSGTPTSDENAIGEVSLDIEMALAMAPCLSKIVVFEGNPNNFIPNDVLASMVANSQIKVLSSSWGWSGGPSTATDNYFIQMAAQGQSYFNASGDSDAFPSGFVDNSANTTVPSSSPYVIQVGGTTLTTTGPGGAWSSETVWNWNLSGNPGVGSSGGISSHYSIPSWQTGISMTANHGSTANRNIPDIALTADNILVLYNNGQLGDFGGTSCAAPLWAGVTALINQQAVSAGRAVAGFLDPLIYTVGKSNIYTSNFHDVTTGNNFWSGSTANFPAVSGYDLCTGWGTPAGQTFITTIAGLPDSLGILPATNLMASSISHETFPPGSQNITLTNSGITSLNWAVTNIPSWLGVSPTNGTLSSGGQTAVALTINSSVTNLSPDYYFADLLFTNFSSHGWQSRRLTLLAASPLSISPSTGFSANGPAGGPFTTTTRTFSLNNIGAIPLSWSLINTSAWLSASLSSGTIAASATSNVVVSLNSAASNLVDGIYNATVMFTNPIAHDAQPRSFTLSVGLLENGGFELGDFTGWTLTGDSGTYNLVDNGSISGITAHSGSYFAALGEVGFLANLSQSISTATGQSYLLSLWLTNPLKGSGANPNEFSVSWDGGTLYDQVNLPVLSWTNLQFIVTASSSATTLQIGGRDDNAYLGLDDVTLTLIPKTFFQATTTTTNNHLKFTWNATTGLVYQIQFKTNLLQPSWLVLKSITATNTTTIFTDTNPITTMPQKFYRLLLLP